jgi:hypothetical protein
MAKHVLFARLTLLRISDLPVYFEPVIDNSYLADFYQGTLAAGVPTRPFCLSLTLLCASPCTEPKKYSFPLQIYLLNNRFRQVPVRAVMSDRPVERYVLPLYVVVAVLTPLLSCGRVATADHLVGEGRHPRPNDIRGRRVRYLTTSVL